MCCGRRFIKYCISEIIISMCSASLFLSELTTNLRLSLFWSLLSNFQHKYSKPCHLAYSISLIVKGNIFLCLTLSCLVLTKKSRMLKQSCIFQLQVCLSMYDLSLISAAFPFSILRNSFMYSEPLEKSFYFSIHQMKM